MFISIFSAVESGIIYAIMALGVYLTFRVLDFPDLTVDGSFVTGAAIASVSIIGGVPPLIATVSAFIAGFVAGCITGFLHTKGKINPLLAGILMQIALYSINLRILGKPTIPLLNESTIFTQIQSVWEKTGIDQALNGMLQSMGISQTPNTWSILFIMIIVTALIKIGADYFLNTETGLALRATGNNKKMIRSFSANTDSYIVSGLGLSNGLVALAGALIAQLNGFADAGMGIGLIVIGLASVIIGEALFGTKTIFRTTLAVLLGAIVYRIVVTIALRVKFLEAGDMKLITAILVIIALISPKIIENQKEKQRRKQKRLEMEGGNGNATSS